MTGEAAPAAGPAAARPGAPLLLAIGLVSASSIAYEILLTRLFAIVFWHHLATAVIGLALLGVGAAGTFVTLTRQALERRLAGVVAAAAAGFALAAPGAFALTRDIGFNPLELIWSMAQQGRLLATAVVLALPFFAAGLPVALGLGRYRGSAGRLYAADLVGAGLGAVIVVGALFVAPPERALAALSALGLAAAALALLEGRQPVAAAALLAAAVAAPWAWPEPWVKPVPSPYKGLSLALTMPGARLVEERSGPLGLVSVVESSAVPFRLAPGLSLSATAEPPPQLGLFTDGDALTAITRFDGAVGPLAYLDQQTSAAAYHLLDRPRVLVLGAGGGSDVLQGLQHGAARIDAVEVNPDVIGLVRDRYDAFTGGLYRRPEVHIHEAEARAFVAGSRGRWDLIEISLLDSFAASAGGLQAAAESPVYTVEALRTYLRHLTPRGILSITRWVQAPPREVLKLFATAAVALEGLGVAEPGPRLVLLRGWSTATLLARGGAPFTPEDIARLRAFCEARSFDLDWYAGMPAAEADRFNRLPGPSLREAAVALLGAGRQRFIAGYHFNIAPATDDRPYFHRFFSWEVVPELARLRRQGGLTLLDAGYLTLAATLVQAAAAGVVLVLLPLAVGRRRRRPQTRGGAGVALYFAALGLAFMFVEIALMQTLTVLIGHPLAAVAVVLSGMLVFAGLGSATARGRSGAQAGSGILRPAAALGGLTVGYAMALPWVVGQGLAAPAAARLALALVLIAPLAFLMGRPFPAGIEAVGRTAPGLVPWAWAVNGCVSVAGAVLAGLLAMHLGLSALLLLAGLLYAVAAAAFPGAGGRLRAGAASAGTEADGLAAS